MWKVATKYVCPPISVRIPDDGITVRILADQGILVPVPSGPPGRKGEDGVSPTIAVNYIEGGHRVTITDTTGTRSFDVPDGAQGEPGEGVPSGGAQGQVLKKASNADYDTEWADESGTILSVNGQTGVVVLDSTDIDHDNEPISDILGGEQTASGNIVTFTDTTGGNPITALSVAVEPLQSGSGDPSPTNIRPISGWDSVTVNRTGKNILPPGTSGTQQGATYTVNPDGTITVTGTATGSSKRILNSVLLKGGTQYVLSGCPIGGGQGKFGLALYETGTNTILGTDFGSGVTYTPVSDGIIDVGIRYWYGQSPAGTWKPQLELGSTATAYEPYTGNTYTIQLGETVYGGTLDVINGTMTVDRAMRTFDGSESWSFIAFGNNYLAYTSISDIDTATPDTQIANLVCNQFKAISYSTGASRTGISGRYQISQINVFQNIFTTVSDWKTYLAENPLQVCYELATPIELTLSPTQIQTLIGENVVWSDAGDVALSVSTGLIGAVETIPNKTSDLTNDSGFVNATQAAAAAPVQSVNGQTGNVSAIPSGGTEGQVLTKSSGTDYATEWKLPLSIVGPLWTNPNPTSTFAAQTISLDLSGYDAILVVIKKQTAENIFVTAFATEKNKTFRANFPSHMFYYREFSFSDTGVTFQDGKANTSYGNANAATYNNDTFPYQIYGIKGVLPL